AVPSQRCRELRAHRGRGRLGSHSLGWRARSRALQGRPHARHGSSKGSPAMQKVTRDQILDYVTYEEQREAIRTRVLDIKRVRRVHVASVLTFLFENADVRHEIDTYNELLGGPGELGCTLMIEIDDPEERSVKLSRWLALPEHV